MADYVVAKMTKGGDEIRKLADTNIQGAIDRVLTQVPAGKKGAVVMYANGDEVRAAIYGRLGRNWSYVATASRSWETGKISGEAAVAFTF